VYWNASLTYYIRVWRIMATPTCLVDWRGWGELWYPREQFPLALRFISWYEWQALRCNNLFNIKPSVVRGRVNLLDTTPLQVGAYCAVFYVSAGAFQEHGMHYVCGCGSVFAHWCNTHKRREEPLCTMEFVNYSVFCSSITIFSSSF
jgi:hypothetical protein